MQKINVGVFGGTGYTGLELIRLLNHHPGVNLNFATSESSAGDSLRENWPVAPDILLQSINDVDLEDIDCVFLCLPHTKSASVARKAISSNIRVVDLSADLRISDPIKYEQWYGIPHPEPELLPAPYGLPELGRAGLVGADVIANPGCYATSILLGLTPLVRKSLILPDTPIIIDAKSGTSGAGRTPKQHILFGEVHGNFSPYNIGRSHRHLGEIEQILSAEGLEQGRLIFSPHLLPTDRGILAAIYVQVVNIEKSHQAFHDFYDQEALVEVLPKGSLATLAHVVRTPLTAISLTAAAETMLIVMVAIDNLLKGASSQAIQNFNLMYGLPETTGLLSTPGASI